MPASDATVVLGALKGALDADAALRTDAAVGVGALKLGAGADLDAGGVGAAVGVVAVALVAVVLGAVELVLCECSWCRCLLDCWKNELAGVKHLNNF